jgi:hypothetical protein
LCARDIAWICTLRGGQRVVTMIQVKATLLCAAAAAAMLFTASLAWAETEVSASIGGDSGNVHYGYDADWWWGDGVLYGDWNHGRSGLYIGYTDGEWDARYRDAGAPAGTHPNDRPGYRVFIPRGLEYPPQHYGGSTRPPRPHRRHDSNGNIVIVQPYPYYGYPYYDPYGQSNYPYAYGTSSPVVIDYSPRETRTGLRVTTGGRGSRSRYTAPDAPEYGYYRPAADEDWDYQVDGQPLVINDNRTYNYYGDAPAPAQPNPSQAAGRAAQAVAPAPASPAPPAAPATPAGVARGARFYDELRLDNPNGACRFSLSGTNLYAGPDTGPAVLLSDNADAAFGAFAAYLPGDGLLVAYRDGAKLVAAYPTGQGAWQTCALPVAVDFAAQVPSLGLVGNALWATVTSSDGKRYVMAFRGGIWTEVGSGSTPPAA